jgi:hypothetical protein
MSRRAASVAPDREFARTPAELAELLLEERDAAWEASFRKGLSALERAQAEAFPQNIFGDLDFVAASVLRQGREADSGALVDELLERMCALQGLYGESTPIRFRYVHDFTYGYDWAKWVRREPAQDGRVGPFDLEFLVYMERRGHQLLELIAVDDRKYPTLRGPEHRNPFPFSREPAAESRLFPELARRGLLPVETWRLDAKARCDRPFADLRVAVAGELGLLVEGAA